MCGSTVRVVHLGRSTCHAISGRGDLSTRIPDSFPDEHSGKACSRIRALLFEQRYILFGQRYILQQNRACEDRVLDGPASEDKGP